MTLVGYVRVDLVRYCELVLGMDEFISKNI